MANGIIADNRLVTASGVTFTHSTEIAGYEAENVQVYQPGESFRTSVLNAGSITAAGINDAVDLVAALYTNVTPHTNICEQSNELDTTWTTTNLGVAQNTSNGGAPGASYSWDLTDDATSGNHSLTIVTVGNAPPVNLYTSYNSLSWTASAYVEDDGGPLDCRLRLESGPANYVECSFDLGAGTAGAPTETGTVWGTPTAAITPITTKIGTGTWYRISITAAVDSSTTTIPKPTLLLESGGNISYSGSSDKIRAQALMVENAASAGTWTANTTDTASFWRITESSSSRTLRKYGPCITSIPDGLPYVHILATITETGVNTVSIAIFDPNNLDGYIEIGNLVIAKSFQPTYNIAQDWAIGWAEDGSSNRAPGGQLYRPVNKRYRQLRMTHEWLTEAESMGDAFEIDRRVGRSEGVLAVVDPDSTYAHQWTVWGLQDGIAEHRHIRYIKGLATETYAKEWTIVEALP